MKQTIFTYIKTTTSTLKILIAVLCLTVSFYAIRGQMAATTRAMYLSTINAMASMQTVPWIPQAPVNLGWNQNDGDDYAEPRPGTELGCGGLTSVNGAAIHWTDVSGGDPLVKYQRQYDVPWTAPGSWSGSEIYAHPYSNYRSFGGNPGTEGTYNTRVRAFYDANDNNQLDALEARSEWSSNDCTVTYDLTSPAVPEVISPASVYTDAPADAPVTGNSSELIQVWSQVEDSLGGEVYYDYESYSTYDGTTLSDLRWTGTYTNSADGDGTQISKHAAGAPDGDVYWRVRSRDERGNTSSWSEVGHFVIDNSSSTAITVSNSPAKDITQRVKNASFDQDLTDWLAQPAVEITDLPERTTVAQLKSGSHLTQTLDNSGHGLRSVGFWYKVETAQDLPENQLEPLFTVYANEQMLFQTNQVSDWQYINLYVAELEDSQFDLKFVSQDQVEGLTVSLDEITTNATVVNHSAVFTVESQTPDLTDYVVYQYRVNGRVYEQQGEPGLEFSLRAQPDDQLLEYWSVNLQGEAEDKNQIQVIYDNQAPHQITDLRVYDENAGDYSLMFSAPYDDQFNAVRKYDIRYSLEPITNQTDWEQLDQVKLDRAPQVSGQLENVMVTGLQPDETYYFAVKAIDQAGNEAIISNVATPQAQDSFEKYTQSPIVINEIMYDPYGQDDGQMPAGEWVELYNTSESELDVANWVIKDASGKELVITPENSDNNLDLTDAGETIVPAQGWLVVYKNGYQMFNNDGDTVSLYNQANALVNSYMYQGTVEEGQTEARLEDGGEHWSFKSIATAGRANSENIADLQPLAKLTQSEPYNVRLDLYDAQGFTQAEYVIEYTHLVDEQPVKEGLKGALKIDSNQVTKDHIYFATCSTDGVCIPHEEVDPASIKLKVTLTGSDQESKQLEAQLSGAWE